MPRKNDNPIEETKGPFLQLGRIVAYVITPLSLEPCINENETATFFIEISMASISANGGLGLTEVRRTMCFNF